MASSRWQIDPSHSSVTVAARHLMLTTVRASFSGVTGTLDFDPERPEAAAIRLEIPATTVDTGDEKRDGHLRSADFLDAGQHPNLVFVSRGIRRVDGEAFSVEGDLTMRGITKPVSIDVDLVGVADTGEGRVVGFTARATIDRTQWGLVWNMPIPGGVLVSEKLKVDIDLQAKTAEAGQRAA